MHVGDATVRQRLHLLKHEQGGCVAIEAYHAQDDLAADRAPFVTGHRVTLVLVLDVAYCRVGVCHAVPRVCHAVPRRCVGPRARAALVRLHTRGDARWVSKGEVAHDNARRLPSLPNARREVDGVSCYDRGFERSLVQEVDRYFAPAKLNGREPVKGVHNSRADCGGRRECEDRDVRFPGCGRVLDHVARGDTHRRHDLSQLVVRHAVELLIPCKAGCANRAAHLVCGRARVVIGVLVAHDALDRRCHVLQLRQQAEALGMVVVSKSRDRISWVGH